MTHPAIQGALRDLDRWSAVSGMQLSDLLAILLAERALNMAAPMGYIARVTALAAKKVNETQPN